MQDDPSAKFLPSAMVPEHLTTEHWQSHQKHKLSFYPNLTSQLLNILEVKLDWASSKETDESSYFTEAKEHCCHIDTFNYKVTDITLA